MILLSICAGDAIEEESMPGESSSLDVTWERVLKVWWALAWRATVFGVIAGAVLGGIGAALTVVAGMGDSGTVGAVLGWVVSVPVSIYALRQVLRKRFRTFSIRLVDHAEGLR
jgi:hypothetical protein